MDHGGGIVRRPYKSRTGNRRGTSPSSPNPAIALLVLVLVLRRTACNFSAQRHPLQRKRKSLRKVLEKVRAIGGVDADNWTLCKHRVGLAIGHM